MSETLRESPSNRARAFFLFTKVQGLQALIGDGPWLDATMGRLRAALGMEPPPLPWYAERLDHLPAQVAYTRERSIPGYLNRGHRRATNRRKLGPLRELRRALALIHVEVTRG